jgi:methylase of polypeptide subunit release factors
VVASDRCDDPDGETFAPPTDVVFPAIYAGTLRFLEFLPDVRGGEALDLCGGSGIGALQLAQTARVAVTADLAERSAQFAEFNAGLNAVPMESGCGDLYAPVRGRQFDVISAHPPFVPATGENMVYRDGGDSGEEVIRGVVAGLPAHLRVGGIAVILCVARDTETQPFERRAQAWLGATSGEFDVVFGLEKILSVAEVIESIRKRGQNVGDVAAQQLFTRLQALGTRQFVYGALFIRRYATPVIQPPMRLHVTPQGRAADFERLLHWRWATRQPGFLERLAQAKPRLAPQLQLTARHRVQHGTLVPADFVFEIATGLQAALRPDAWVVPLVARLEGDRTVAAVFEAAAAADELPPGFKLDDFLGLVGSMIERGFLVVDDLAQPH